MTNYEIVEFLNNEIKTASEFLESRNKKKTLIGNVMANRARHYSEEVKIFLNSTIKPDINNSLMSQIYCAINNVTSYPICPICGNEVKRFHSFFNGWYETCCKECANEQKYGVRNAAKVKSVQEKITATTIKRHGGIGWASKNIKDKCNSTMRKKYGENLEKLVEKTKQTNVKKYGATHIMKTEEGVAKYLESRDYNDPEYIQKCRDRFYNDNLHAIMVRSRLDKMYDKLVEVTKNDVKFLFSKEDYRSFCEDVNGNGLRIAVKYKFKCKHCNTIFESTFKNLKRDEILHCPGCKVGIRSWVQHALKLKLEQNYPDYSFQEDRIGVLSGRKELDIYCPELNFAIEYNGLNWHAEQYNGFTKFRHYDKWKECSDLDVKFLGIWSDELDKYGKRIRTMIDSFFKKTSNLAYISNIDIIECDKAKARSYAIDRFHKCFVVKYFDRSVAYFYLNDKTELIDFWFTDNELDNIYLFDYINKQLGVAECIFENRFLSYYLQFISEFKVTSNINPRFYKFDKGRSFYTNDENKFVDADRIWNYGYTRAVLTEITY